MTGLSQRYGGIVALNAVSFAVEAGTVVGLIGPNGAGKTTLFNCITGLNPPTAGDVAFQGSTVLGLRPHRLVERGMARTFQGIRLFADMTALENVMVGAFQKTSHVADARDSARRALASVGLGDKADAHAQGLSTGQRKRLELARALATAPRLLLLDEVTGGVDQATVPGLVRLVRDLHAGGLALVVIEHNMRVIMEISQRIVALQLGQVIADAPPADIVRDRRVIDAYLGESWRA